MTVHVGRKNFGKLPKIFEMPNLLEIQVDSYEIFLQINTPKTKLKSQGLHKVLNEIFPIESYDQTYKLEYVNYSAGTPRYSIDESITKGATYAAPLKLTLRLKSKKDVKEQEVYFGEFPLMTPHGTFIINGDERVVVSQLHRSPGVIFEESVHPNGRTFFSSRIIPYHGAWIEIEFDLTDALYVILDRRRKVLATVFLRALGYNTDEEILATFCGVETIKVESKSDLKDLVNKITAADVRDESGNFVLLEKRHLLTEEELEKLWEANVRTFKVIVTPYQEILNTLAKDHIKTQDEALLDIFKKMRPGDPATLEAAKALLERLFFDQKRYDLSRVGRFIINRKLNMRVDLETRTLTPETIVETIKYLLTLKRGKGTIDDIDHLGNRRIRTVGELLENQIRIALVRLERSVKERMAIYDLDNCMPHHLVNAKLVSSMVKDFFARSQLSQFMDQTNPLAEMTHKRRLSAMGPGGLSRKRAGFEVRDVHFSHYGRICPIETPEGPNIGLINSLCTYTKLNEFGFLVTPYRKVENGRITNKIDYLTASEEDQCIVAQANASLTGDGKFAEKLVLCRHRGDFPLVPPEKINYMDVSPAQIVSLATALIPFLEHNDANRALMGSNMQRQAVPLLFSESPLIGTGVEHRAAKDSGVVVVAKNTGTVRYVDAGRIEVGNRTYMLKNFKRSNSDTCIHQRPIVKIGQSVKEGDIIADGAGTDRGELSMGKNLLVAFMPWRGYNFEDAIIINERLVKEDIFTSLHIQEFEIDARETRLGNEEITRDIPNVSEEALKDLDENGIIRVGAHVEPGDILVGKVAPKSETELSSEERLLRAIFGEKAGDVRDASLIAPPGVEGIVVDVSVFSKKRFKGRSKEDKTKEADQIKDLHFHYQEQIKKAKEERVNKLAKMLVGKKAAASLLDIETGEVVLAANKKITKNDVKHLDKTDIEELKLVGAGELEQDVKRICALFEMQIAELLQEEENEIDRLRKGDELPPGVLKKTIVYVASKRKIQVGDKLAGRHGNKGVVAKIVPQEDMPFLEDGTPVDIILNPLGVPSRMNLGQLLETHLGWAAKILKMKIAAPVFDGPTEAEIKALMKNAEVPNDGKVVLYDGRTGETFKEKITVGYIYMMKLVHMVDDKIHARAIGPYSLVTQQPLGGKAQFGGQRFGEMEVWALEAYGAAYTLQELLTVKSDDVQGRTKIYEALVKGDTSLEPGIPESFNVLMKELQGLALDVKTEKEQNT